MMQAKEIPWGGWEKCLEISTEQLTLIVTLEVGPRILFCSLKGCENVLGTIKEDLGSSGDSEWKFYGGHRLWHSPEHSERTYVPDNGPVQWSLLDSGFVEFSTGVEDKTLLEKKIRLLITGNTVKLEHELINHGLWPIEFSPWALTVLAKHAKAEVPNEPYVSHDEALLPARAFILWPYSKLNDPRLTFLDDSILVNQDPAISAPLKLGFSNSLGWIGAEVSNQWFVKRFQYSPNDQYPDMGSNCEIYTDSSILELETLGALKSCLPSESLLLTEEWQLFKSKDEWLTAVGGEVI